MLNKAKTCPSLTLWSKGCQSNQMDYYTNVQIYNCDCWHCQRNNKEQCGGWAETRESMTTISHKEKRSLHHHSRIGRHQVSEWPLKHFQVKQYIYDSLELRCYFWFDLIWYETLQFVSDCSRRVCKEVINNKKLHQYLQSPWLFLFTCSVLFIDRYQTAPIQYSELKFPTLNYCCRTMHFW